MMKTSRAARGGGFTLIELIVAMAVMLVAVAAATSLLIAAMRLARDSQGNVEAGERARLASAEMIENIERAGMGMGAGVTVSINSTPTLISPIFGTDAFDGGTDDLWVVTPTRNATGESCHDPGAKVPLTGGSGATIPVPCSATFANFTGAGKFLAITSPSTGKAALYSTPAISSGTAMSSFETTSVSGFPAFATGDELMAVQVLHYYIAPNPNDTDPAGNMHPALFRAVGKLSTTGTEPFVNETSPKPVVEIPDVEDLQISYGIDPAGGNGANDPNTYTFVDTLNNPVYQPLALPNMLKSLRISVVARSHLTALREGTVNTALVPLTVENHVPAATPDGFERVIFIRRVELPNMAAVSL